MQDDTRAALDAETPVNPYSLLEAVNTSSRATGVAWLIFLVLMAYLAVTVGGITHRDLLLNSGVVLPILQVRIDLTRFFLFAPIVLVLAHAVLLGQLALLAGKTLEFTSALRMLEATDQRTHPLRLEVDSFFFVQAMAGPERSRVMGAFLHGMSWLTLVILPLLLLLYMQVAFLPFHDAGVTALHRLAVLADVALLALVGVFLVHPETSIVSAYWRSATIHPIGFVVAAGAAGRGGGLLGALRHGAGRGARPLLLHVRAAPGCRGEGRRPCSASHCRRPSARPTARCSASFRATSSSPTEPRRRQGPQTPAGRRSTCAAATCALPGSIAPTCARPT